MRLSDFASFFPYSSSIKSEDLENFPPSLRDFESSESEDFCLRISDGLTFRSSELVGELSESFLPGDEESVGADGGSTGAPLRGNFGGGLCDDRRRRKR